MAQSTGDVVATSETVDAAFDEIMPLVRLHAETIQMYEGAEPDPDLDRYRSCESAGILRVYALRHYGAMVGYAVYVVGHDPQYRSIAVAMQDSMYLMPAYRGRYGMWFIRWCNERLKEDGVQYVRQSTTVQHDYSRVLERMGYHLAGSVYIRKL